VKTLSMAPTVLVQVGSLAGSIAGIVITGGDSSMHATSPEDLPVGS
jgi:hypothetical protein